MSSDDDDNRLTIHELARTDLRAQFANDVARGLRAAPKNLPPKYFYDELGSTLFDAICLLPEYYLTRAEIEILNERAREILREFCAGDERTSVALLEAGSGSAFKTRRLIEGALARQNNLLYMPIDISASALEGSARVLLQSYPSLRVEAYASDYETALHRLRDKRPAALADARTLALFLGSNVGNFAPGEAVNFLRALRPVLREGDALLLGADLKKDRRTLEAAYDDSLGVTSAFNLNLLARINRELGGDFDIWNFKHIAFYDEVTGAIQTFIESRTAQRVRIKSLQLEINFDAGERMHTESSYKYDIEDIAQLAARSGFQLVRTWNDARRMFSSNLLRAAA